ncbi:MAG: hypothetical protein BGO70_06030 [Bacteroidetes bacterium 43-93]|mgnify:CR=1 FL=1|nr:tetratricopeptide repeat protein [Bacteroidota bacterium]OJW97351.1 MAG: hypothetical protein BGO70_06030 [Bacteroidetes bacterium 43-93]
MAIFAVNTTKAQSVHILDKPFPVVDSTLDSIWTSYMQLDTIQGLQKVKDLRLWGAKQKNDYVKYGTRLAELKYYIYKIKGFRNADSEFTKLIADVEDKPAELRAQVYYVYSLYLFNDYSTALAAFENGLNAYDIYSKLTARQFPKKSLCLFNLGISYYRFKDYEDGKKIFLESIAARPLYKAPLKEMIYNALALCYRNTGVYDSALYYFHEAYQMSIRPDSVWMGIIIGNIGITYYLQGKYDEAIPLLQTDIRLGLRGTQVSNTAKSIAVLGDIYLNTGKEAEGMKLLKQAYHLIDSNNKWTDYDLLQYVYPILAKAYIKNGNAALAYAFLDSALRVRDSIGSQRNALTLAKAKQNLATQKYNMKVREAESQRNFNVLLRDALIVGILLLAVIALLIINRQKIRHNQNLQKLEVEKWKAEVDKRRAESELVTAEHRLADFTRSLKEKNELIEQFASEIERYKTISSEQDRVSQQDALLQLQRSTILTDDQWEDFRSLFEQVHSGYLNRLREKLPLLTPAETRFITLSKLKLSNKEMAGVLGISNDAVRMSKHRLRKKLNLTTDEELEQVIETI